MTGVKVSARAADEADPINVLKDRAVKRWHNFYQAFGGEDLRTLYVTSARQMREPDELARLPHSGGVFAMRVDVPGLPEPHCTI